MMAGDGEQAWKCIRISAPDLIVSDVMMPYKDGYTLCKELKNDPEYCHIPIILLTAKADMENQLHGLDLGADGYLGKPFDPTYLTALVRNLLANRRRLQGLLADRTSSSPAEDPRPDGLTLQDRAFLTNYRLNRAMELLKTGEYNISEVGYKVGFGTLTGFSRSFKNKFGVPPSAI
ncbi:MAG: response regulator [Bacteroidales bacterium]|nr:response regulator [Bacteroidales bacterium]